jgi:hypothetical protein
MINKMNKRPGTRLLIPICCGIRVAHQLDLLANIFFVFPSAGFELITSHLALIIFLKILWAIAFFGF